MELSNELIEQIAKIGQYMAESGHGTNKCLEYGWLPVPVHFYSPLPDIKDLENRGIFKKKSSLAGINRNIHGQLEFLDRAAGLFREETKEWPLTEQDTGGDDVFFMKNNCFSYDCASALHYMIRYFRPQRIIEVGSGLSSRVINEALAKNHAASDPPLLYSSHKNRANYTIVDPYATNKTQNLANVSNVRQQKVETCTDEIFLELQSGDILFVDSSHSVKAGGDVNFIILDILPKLNSGVIIHFHDISLPNEYDRQYFINESFRMFWTEAYLLQAFMAHNPDFEILLAMTMLGLEKPEQFKKAFPYRPEGSPGSGSFWIRRR